MGFDWRALTARHQNPSLSQPVRFIHFPPQHLFSCFVAYPNSPAGLPYDHPILQSHRKLTLSWCVAVFQLSSDRCPLFKSHFSAQSVNVKFSRIKIRCKRVPKGFWRVSCAGVSHHT